MSKVLLRFSIESDATFGNNQLRMPLAHLVGITNTNQTCCEDFNLIHQQMADLVWGECCPFPQVVITDKSKGMIKSLKENMPKFVPPALKKFRQKKSKGAKARALTAAELAEQTAAARNTRKCRRAGVEVEEETQMTQDM